MRQRRSGRSFEGASHRPSSPGVQRCCTLAVGGSSASTAHQEDDQPAPKWVTSLLSSQVFPELPQKLHPDPWQNGQAVDAGAGDSRRAGGWFGLARLLCLAAANIASNASAALDGLGPGGGDGLERGAGVRTRFAVAGAGFVRIGGFSRRCLTYSI